MKEQARQGFLYGTLVLAVGTVIVKLIGAFFKIPLTNILGGVGMSYFNVAYDLYYPLYALFVSGVPIAVSKMVSENVACGRMRDARKLLRLSVLLFVGVGLIGSLLMLGGAEWFTTLVDNPDARYAVWMLSPALFFGCVMAALRGYFQGLQNMMPTALSQVVEAVSKLVCGLALSYGITVAGLRQFSQEGSVFGFACASMEQAQLMVLPFAAAGAILGVTLSTVCGALFMLARHRLGKRAITAESISCAPPALSSRMLIRRLVAVAIPVCVASVITNLTSFIDLISVMNELNQAIRNSPEIVTNMYAGAIPEGIGIDRLSSYLYGCYSGLAVPIYNLVPSLTAAIGISLLPAVTAAWATRSKQQLERNIGSALRLSALIAMPAGLGICALAQPILSLLYFSKPMEVMATTPALRIMGIGAIFVAISLPVNAILQAIGRADLPVKLLLIGGVVKLLLNNLLVSIPQINIQAAPVGTLACYLFVLSVSLLVLVQTTGVELPIMQVFGKPLFGGLCCAGSAWGTHRLLEQVLSPQFATICAIVIGGIVYLSIILLTKTITKVDVLMIPGGEKFAKLLAKHSLLG